MKINKKYMHIAYIRTVLGIASMNDLAERISKHSATEVGTVKSKSFSLRRKADAELSDSDLEKAFYEAVCDILEEDIEETTDYISENFDFPFDPDEIAAERLIELFDISRDGRLIYVELDI